MKHSLTVGVPVHNGARWVDVCLRSLEEQTDKDFTTIVVCDSCTDGTEQIVRGYKERLKRLRVICGKYGSPSGARNAILDDVDTELITFLDSDDLLTLRAVEEMRNAPYEEFVSFAKRDVTFGTLERVGGVPCNDTVWLHGKVYRMDFLRGMRIRFDEALTYNEDVRFNGEVLACLVAANDRWQAILSPTEVYLRRLNEHSMTNDLQRWKEDAAKRDPLFCARPYMTYSRLLEERGHDMFVMLFAFSAMKDAIGMSQSYAKGERKAYQLSSDIQAFAALPNIPDVIGMEEQIFAALAQSEEMEDKARGRSDLANLTEREEKIVVKVFARLVSSFPRSWRRVVSVGKCILDRGMRRRAV